MEAIAEIKIVISPSYSSVRDIVVILHHVVISELLDRQQALQARIHVAVESVVLKADDSVLEVGQTFVNTSHRIRLRIVVSSVMAATTILISWLLPDRFDIHFIVREFDFFESASRDQCGPPSIEMAEEVEQVLVHVVELLLLALVVVTSHGTHLLHYVGVVHWARMLCL